ncbi:unnamed protein product [Hydatigera taeniaeformis]|uniref:Uncharacterized protein n=1 Tax=Hydatigena taeniaeformis TaxID=6205 RepID=A0A3P7GRM3_HYDTA|nr:unnamed protein product [Hydatigera taeniaeformis]
MPTPLERFTHFAQLDPRFLMPLHLAEAYERKALASCGTALRQLAIRLPPNNVSAAPATLTQFTRPPPAPAPALTRPQLQLHPLKGLSLA